MKLTRIPFLILALLIIMAFFLNTWQGFRFARLRAQVQQMEEEQKEWLDKNKKLIASLAVFSSPARIARIAEEQLGLKQVDSFQMMKILIRPQRAQQESRGGEVPGE